MEESVKARILISAMLLLFLNGCAAPIGFEIAGWIKTLGDVGSYMVTDKSLTDHVVSNYKEEDCAFHRFLVGKDICTPIVQIAEDDIEIVDDTEIAKIKLDKVEVVKVDALFPPEPKTPATPSVIVDLSVLDDLPKPNPSVTINWDVLDNLK